MLFKRLARLANNGAATGSEQDAPDRARRVGADLTAARDRLGWTLPDVAAHLRIRLPYLVAIEQGRLEALPGNAYAVGFVRTYAKALGLDPEQIAGRFRAEAAQVGRKTELAFPAPVPERGVPAGAVVLLGALLVTGAYVGWYRASGERPGSEPVQPVPERLAELAQPAPVAPLAAVPATPSPAAPLAAPLPAIAPSSAAAAVPSGARVAAPPPVPATAAALPEGTRIVLRARTEAWMQVRDRQGQVLLNRVLRPGETWPVPGKGALLLTTGNAGGTELLIDGALAPSLGAEGSVRRDLALEADALRDIKLPVATAPRPAVPPPAVRTP